MQTLNQTKSLFTESVIRRMTRVALSVGAVNLAQGFPDFDPPKAMLDRLAEVSYEGPHQYPIDMGAPNFRRAVSAKYARFMGWAPDPEEEICVTMGSTEAMVDTLFTLTNPGDRVLLFSPYFENYYAQILTVGCVPVFIPLAPPDYGFDANLLEDEMKKGAKAILICNPSNPSGKVFSKEEFETIASLCVRYDVYAITDEVYEHIVFDGHVHQFLSNFPGMRERTVICSSLSKTYSITGWRLGYAIAPKEIMDGIKQYHDFVTVGAASPLMEAAVVGLNMPDSYYAEFQANYAHKKDLFVAGLRAAGIPYTEPQGTYFVLADVSPFMKKTESDVEFCERLARDGGVACVPGSSFFRENVHGIVRMHFAKKEETLREALKRLENIKKI